MATRNATVGVEGEVALLERRGEAPGIAEVQSLLGLPEPPYRIEGYDISNLMGTHTVASIVVFAGGRARRSEYRKLRIHGLDKPDDFYSMHQAVYRRFTGRLADSLEPPDLLLIDGGKGQLSAARRALEEAGVNVPIVGLAKRQETIITERGEEVLVPVTHPGLKLLINVRDEAHRVAVTYNRKQRGAAMKQSLLDDVPGIGPKRRDSILDRFSSVDEIRNASIEQLSSVPGVGPAAAETIQNWFAQELEVDG
jgi:excinuclease ABC subunit C